MVSHSAKHYDLISYRDKYIFQFTEIPYDIKMLILNKCLERNAGPYYLIQDFRNFKTRLGLDADEGRPADYSDEDGNGDLYDETVQFIVYPRASSHKTSKPGKADGEKIPPNRTVDFIPLSKIPEWRKKLDDCWMDTGEIIRVAGERTYSWPSVFHYTEASKYKMGHPEIYKQFAIESGTETSTNIQNAKSHKYLVIPGSSARTNIKTDVDYVLGRDLEERDKALRAKFIDNLKPDMREALLSTKNALILRKLHNGEAPQPDMQLMRIRKELQMDTSA
jgi:hypothetical protein